MAYIIHKRRRGSGLAVPMSGAHSVNGFLVFPGLPNFIYLFMYISAFVQEVLVHLDAEEQLDSCHLFKTFLYSGC